MADLNVLIVGDAGSGKSTAARVVTKALREAGFQVELTDKDDMNQERFDKCIKALRGKVVRVTCGNVHLREQPQTGSEKEAFLRDGGILRERATRGAG